MPIELDRKEGNYGSGKGGKKKYKTTKKSYYECDLFEKIVHEEIIKDKSGTFFYLTSDFYGIGVWNKRIFFTDISNFVRAEVFFPINGNIPLVLGVITTGQKYYRLSELKNFPNLKDISTKKSYSHNQLLDNLIKENNKQNNVITYRLDKTKTSDDYDGVVVESLEHPSFDKYKHTFNGQLESRTICILYGGHKISLDRHSGYSKSDKLEVLDGKKFCEVIVFYLKLSNKKSSKLPSYIELKLNETISGTNEVNATQIKTYYLEKADFVGVSWKQIENPELDETITYLLDSNESGSYNDNSITVKNEPHPSFNVSTHTLYSDYRNRKAYLLFTDKYLTLIHNSYIEEKDRLQFIQLKPYLSVTLFYYKALNTPVQEFLELEEKVTVDENSEVGISDDSEESLQSTATSPKRYLLERADQEGISWKQIDYQDLKNTTIFRLECKEEHSDGYENSVTVTKEVEQYFNIYIHTPKDVKKCGMFLYKWKVIFLQKNDELQQIDILESLKTKQYSKIFVYYKRLYDTEEPPFFIDIVENKSGDESYSSVGGSSNRFFLQRVDPYGFHWKQIRKPNTFGKETTDKIIEEITNNNKNSIMVPLTEKDMYSIQIVKHHRTDGICEPTNPPRSTRPKLKTLSDSSYQYYEHNFSVTKELEESNIERLRLFMKYIEIKIYDKTNNIKIINYNPVDDSNKKIQVFFYQRDPVPLLFIWDGNPYTSSKNDYFTKWKQAIELEKLDLANLQHCKQIKSKLDYINAEYNEILLEQTSGNGYGIASPPGKQTPSGFSTSRVTVIKESPQKKYYKIIHTTKNNSSIGKVLFRATELENDSGTKLSKALSEENELISATVVSVIVYYHKTDGKYKKPLLLGFAKLLSRRTIPQNTDVFYRRQSIDNDIKWTKITLPDDLRELRQDPGLADKINKIHYNIGKSAVIQVDYQTREGGSHKYQVQLILNANGDGAPEPVGSGQITVTKNGFTTTQPTGYTCCTHRIPDLSSSTASDGSTNNPYVSGLKLYICEKTYLNTNVQIYYDPNKSEVKVYFYQHTVGTSSDPPLDKVPLLVEYNGNYYKPSSRDEYFTKWVLIDGIDSTKSEQITSKLDEINKSLNEVDISRTTITSYGLTKPEKEIEELDQKFCNRVSVEKADNNHYKKLIHSTTNKGPIGSVVFSGKMIDGFNFPRLGAKCNKVEVYYHISDSSYTKPLLIHITYQNNDFFCNNWYYRWNLDGTQWKHDTPTKYNTDHSIRDQLNQINASMSVFLYLQIDKQEHYKILAKSRSETKENEYKADIIIDKFKACSYDPGNNYRCYKHKMSEYYNLNEDEIRRALQTQEQPTLEVKITIVGYELNLENSDGSYLPTQLSYGPKEQGTDTNPYVYFFEYSGQTDKVPLLFMFGDQFFGPVSKDLFFEKWKKYTIYTHTGATVHNIKTTLNQITRLLNLIDLQQTSTTYGDLGRPGDRSRNPLGAEKRVSVRKQNVADYNSVTHSTANTGCVGTVNYGDRELEIVSDQGESSTKWSKKIEAELKSVAKPTDIYNELTVYYHKSDSAFKNPLLIKISGSSGGSHSRVEDLYYERAEKDYKYKWKKVGAEELRKSKDDSWLAHKINAVFSGFDQSVTIPLGQPPSNNHHESNVVRNGGQETDSSDPKNGDTASSLNPDHPATSSIPSQQHTTRIDEPQGLVQGAPGEHVKQQQQESRVQGDRGESSGSPTDQETTGVEGPNGSMGDTGSGLQIDSVSQGTGLTPVELGKPGLNGQGPEPSPQEPGNTDAEDGVPPADGNGLGGSGGVDSVKTTEDPGGQDGEASAQGDRGEAGSPSPTGPSADKGNLAGGGSSNSGTLHQIMEVIKKPEVYASASGVAGVGVMATVGGVVYKKCIVGGAVAAGKAAAKVAASAASGM